MTDAPKHPTHPDPANELASDASPIDPRDFRNALGTYATGVTIITAVGGRRKALRADLQFVRVGVAESAAGAVEPRDVFARPDHLPERQPFRRQRARRIAAGAGEQIRQILRRQIRRRRMDAGPRQRAGSRRQRRQFSMPRRQPLLWRRPCDFPRRRRGLCLQPAGAAAVRARRLRPVSRARTALRRLPKS